MGIFKKRPLAAACFTFVLSVFLSFFFSERGWQALIVICLLLALVGLIVAMIRRKKHAYFSLYLALCCVFCILGIFRTAPYRMVTEELLKAESGEVALEVIKCVYESKYSSEFAVKILEFNGRTVKKNAILRTDGETFFSNGERIFANVEIKPRSFETFDKRQANTYFSDGICVILLPNEILETELTDGGSERLQAFRNVCFERLTERLTAKNGRLAGAMLLGERSALENETVRNFRRSGVSHLLAISGLHLTVIMGLIERVLYLFHCPRRFRIFTVLLCCIGYTLLTGASPSTLRAMLMLLLFSLSYFFRADSDSVTSLCASGALILLIAPYAVFGAAYQLTMLATFGLLAYAKISRALERHIPKRSGVLGALLGLLRVILSSFIVTLSATVLIFPVFWLVFGEFALATPIVNLLLVPLVSPFLICSLFLLVFSFSPMLSYFLAFPINFFGDIFYAVTAYFAKTNTMISLRYDFCNYIFIPMTVALLVLLLLDLKKRYYLSLSPIFLAITVFPICLFAGGHMKDGRIEIYYHQEGENEALLLVGGGKTMLCDFSSGEVNVLDGAYLQMSERGATEISVLLLTTYREAYSESFLRLSGRVLVRELWVPEAKTEKERRILLRLCEAAEARGCSVSIYRRGEALRIFGTASLTVLDELYESRSVLPARGLHIEAANASFLYMSAAYMEYRKHSEVELPLPTADVVFLGKFGPRPRIPILLPADGERAILTDESQLLLLEIEDSYRYRYLSDERCQKEFYLLME